MQRFLLKNSLINRHYGIIFLALHGAKEIWSNGMFQMVTKMAVNVRSRRKYVRNVNSIFKI